MMDIFFLLILIYLSYRNAMQAKAKGYTSLSWGIITFIAIFMGEMIGSVVVIFYFCRKVINVSKLSDPAYKDTAIAQLQQAFMNNPLHPLTIILCGFGGYLLVMYIISKKPDKNDASKNDDQSA